MRHIAGRVAQENPHPTLPRSTGGGKEGKTERRPPKMATPERGGDLPVSGLRVLLRYTNFSARRDVSVYSPRARNFS
ncbi:MAG: hypothetical protein JWN24_3764 [Phycisphaerales bacterium]|nr:hypothetical protein [Phycisphaerales bacterium]